MKHDYQERKQNRITRALELARKKEQESDQLYDHANKMASVIPMGQPILVGHHSEKRDRRYRSRIHNTFGKAFKSAEQAEYYREKAQIIESNDAISSDDPEAISKLEDKLAHLSAHHAFMKAANKCVRKHDMAAFLQLDGASEELWKELHDENGNPVGFPHYRLPYAKAEMKRIETRIALLKRYDGQENEETEKGGVRILRNVVANRVQIFFPSKPDEETRTRLKKAGFRWCRRESAWQRQLSSWAEWQAKDFLPAG
ncbi:DUF3560 domain-containing protein [Chitinophaga cymbidii]|uniref:Conjugal transfer protein TraC n=2 Tax=Chitinophaga TaxID=79328 RepID=A0A512RS89_9BACT|nr:DUF3560 domain-containing protein [Chitinophaga cymbidii]GEP98559.1 hypothetical protein CCY01nite_48190 [Chitinophaga cymbidii]